MKTKLVKFEAPKESTIYNPPLKIRVDGAEKDLYAYIKGVRYPFIVERDGYTDDTKITIEVADEPQRMTNFQLLQFLNRGGWIMKNIFGAVGASAVVEIDKLNNVADKLVKVSRIEKIEWIEPTTDLLEE